MKKSNILSRIVLICVLGLLMLTCQKETLPGEDQLTSDIDPKAAINSLLSKSGGIAGYLTNLNNSIKTMVKNDLLSNKYGKVLSSNLEEAIKSIRRGERRDATRYLNSFLSGIDRLVHNGIITSDVGQALQDVARYAVKSINGTPVITDGLISFYPFNGNANDRSGNSRNGVSSGITYSTDRNSEVNSSAVFNSTGSIRLPGIGQTNGSFSIALWYKTTQDGTILVTDNIFLGTDNTYNQFIISWNISIGTFSPGGAPLFLTDTWHHVVVTHDSNAGIITTYFDGAVWFQRPESGYFLGNNEDIYLGIVVKQYNIQFPYIKPYFVGSIDDLYFFNRAVNASEVEQLYYYPH